MIKKLLLILNLYYLDGVLTCYGGYNYDYGGTTRGPGDEDGLSNESLSGVSGVTLKPRGKKSTSQEGWKPSDDMKGVWKDWLAGYKSSMNGTDYVDPDSEFGKELAKEREQAGDWPWNWIGMGAGNGGDGPPPWAFVKIHVGKPAICTLPPAKGHCKDNVQRWGYNPYADDCLPFPYSGCGGNRNNFVNKVDCVKKCMVEPQPDCEEETVLQADDNIWQ